MNFIKQILKILYLDLISKETKEELCQSFIFKNLIKLINYFGKKLKLIIYYICEKITLFYLNVDIFFTYYLNLLFSKNKFFLLKLRIHKIYSDFNKLKQKLSTIFFEFFKFSKNYFNNFFENLKKNKINYLSPSLNIYYPIKFALKSIDIRFSGLILIFFLQIFVFLYIIKIIYFWCYFCFISLSFYRFFSVHQKQTVLHLKLFFKLITILISKINFLFNNSKQIIPKLYKNIKYIKLRLIFIRRVLKKIKIKFFELVNLGFEKLDNSFLDDKYHFFLLCQFLKKLDSVKKLNMQIRKIKRFFHMQKYKFMEIILILKVLKFLFGDFFKSYFFSYFLLSITSYFYTFL